MAKIIIVEDDPMISEIYQKKFSASGYDVIMADSGKQALDLIKKNDKVDLILLDLVMPKMDGFEVIRRIRSGDHNRDAKIIIFSNLSQREDQEKAFKLGANGFIIKSDYTPSALVKEISRILNQFREEEKNEQRRAKKSKSNKTENAKRILLIEDEDIFIEMFGKKLTQDGYIVESAKNGAWGLKEAFSKKFDIFIIDMVMPAMSGDEIVERLKSNDKTKDIPILVLSASVDNSIKKKVMGLGANKFFVKTQIIPSELSREVDKLLK